MLSSLRFRLPALFVLGIVLAAVVATLIAVRFFQSNTRSRAASELRSISAGIGQLYERQAGVGHISAANLKLALGDNEIFWVPAVPGATLLAGPLPPLCAALLGLMALAESGYHMPVNIGNPNEFTLLELSKIVIEVTGSRSEIVFEALPTDDPQVRQPDITLAREILGWEPKVDLREGLRRTIEQSGVEALVGAGH